MTAALHAALALDVSASRQNTDILPLPLSYALPPSDAGAAASGFYTRAWVRSRDGSWKVALDVLQPQQ